MGWMWLLGSIKSYISFAEYCRFHRTLAKETWNVIDPTNQSHPIPHPTYHDSGVFAVCMRVSSLSCPQHIFSLCSYISFYPVPAHLIFGCFCETLRRDYTVLYHDMGWLRLVGSLKL